MISALHCWEIVCLCEMSWTCYKKSCLLGHFVYETVCLLSGQFVSTYNICFATRVAWWKGNIFVTVLNVMNNISTKICRSFLNAYNECHSLKVSTMSPRILWKLVSMSELLASRNVTPGSWSAWSRVRRYSGQATPLQQTCKRWFTMFFCLAMLLSHF